VLTSQRRRSTQMFELTVFPRSMSLGGLLGMADELCGKRGCAVTYITGWDRDWGGSEAVRGLTGLEDIKDEPYSVWLGQL